MFTWSARSILFTSLPNSNISFRRRFISEIPRLMAWAGEAPSWSRFLSRKACRIGLAVTHPSSSAFVAITAPPDGFPAGRRTGRAAWRSYRCTVRTPFPKYLPISFHPLRNCGDSVVFKRYLPAGTPLQGCYYFKYYLPLIVAPEYVTTGINGSWVAGLAYFGAPC